MKRTVLTILLAIWPAVALADWNVKASTTMSFDSNPFLAPVPESDLVTRGSAAFGQTWDSEHWSMLVTYEGTLTSFAEHAGQNYLLHRIETAAQRDLGTNGWLRATTGARFRVDSGDYNIYDYGEWRAALDTKVPVGDRSTLFSGYRLTRRAYDLLTALDNTEHDIYGRLHHSFDNGTAISISSDLGYRHYLTTPDAGNAVAIAAPRGNRAVSGSTSSSGSGQWVNTLSVSTPLFDNRTGFRAMVKQRSNFGDPARLFSDPDAGHFTDDGLYDDRFTYESREFETMLSRTLPHAITARIGYDQAIKEYRKEPVFSTGNPEPTIQRRSDYYRSLWLRLEKPWLIGNGGTRLNLSAECKKSWNDSNTPDNRYTTFTTTIALELEH